ncbi:reverse transcriptase domain-containing protein [Macrococcoides canis]|uniref:Reverse transcriptase (RNA-dependent DNA polymerase) n=1 Tax=Macrococcoides canis TaxID=1855823 RepID=A0A1W7A972_9STAP|nr:reverse transcriptase domain-containing protein [Macrococcus canis]ARQ06185.1 Reverse transcriptase (RNA-dependent DNA polymerase) [Macrococcus canis]
MRDIDSKQLAYKIMNELKYNKRNIYMWKELISNVENQKSKKFFEILIERIEYVKDNLNDILLECNYINLFKKYSVSNKSNNTNNNTINFNIDNEINTKEINYNKFFIANIDIIIISALWMETVGKLIDSSLKNINYANRLNKNSNAFFKYFYSEYINYRNDAFQAMEQIVDNKKEGLLIQKDITKCYDNIDLKYLKNKVNQYLTKDKEKYYREINEVIFAVIDIYNEMLEGNTYLPFGFLPSGILVNLYFENLDNMIIDEFNPISYGRYVDDITFIIRKDFENEYEKKINRVNEKIELIKDKFNEDKEIKFNFNEEKSIFFVLSKGIDRNYLRKFENEISKFSSDFNKLIDVNHLDEEISSAYNIVLNPIKLNDLFEIKKDKKTIAKTISAVLYTIYGEPIQNYGRNHALSKKIIQIIDENIDKKMFIELYDYWLALLLIEITSLKMDYRNIHNEDLINLSIYKKIIKIRDEIVGNKSISNLNFTKFLNHYLEIFNLIFGNNKTAIDLLENYILPKYKNENYKEYFLNYDKQLNYIYKLSTQKNVMII